MCPGVGLQGWPPESSGQQLSVPGALMGAPGHFLSEGCQKADEHGGHIAASAG